MPQLFGRFASLFAASFLENLASAVRRSKEFYSTAKRFLSSPVMKTDGSKGLLENHCAAEYQHATVYGNGKSLRTVTKDRTFVGLGKVGRRAAQSFQQNINHPATVTQCE
ncbi:MAG: hypothetical protein IJU76_13120 [Desulfovibrionaceae bacterium]|nr:hypothetical protein [Desulfovibrionaceae bacterium]